MINILHPKKRLSGRWVMKRESTGIPAELLDEQKTPCISIYMPTGRRHPENIQDALHFKNLVNQAREAGIALSGKREVDPLIDRLVPLIDDHDFWMHSLEGIAVFVSPDQFRVLHLQEPVTEHVNVSGSGRFFIKPLLRTYQGADRFQVLAFTRTDIRMFEGNRFRLDEIRPAAGVPKTLVEALGNEITPPHPTVSSFGGADGGGFMRHEHSSRKDEEEIDEERFYRAVDRAVTELHSMKTGLPLFLAGLPEHQSIFRSVSHNPYLAEEGIIVDPRLIGTEDLRKLAWAVLEPRWTKKLDDTVARYEEYRTKALGDDDPVIVARAAAEGRVWSLLLDSERQYPGSVDQATGNIFASKEGAGIHEDVLEEIAMLVLDHGGEVLVLPGGKMPCNTGVAALFRYA
jgi:hypothetical protein